MNLEQELRLVAIEFPPEPDLRARVLAQLDRPPRARRRYALAVALAALAIIGGLMAIPQTRAAILDFLQIGNVRVERVDTQPTATGRFDFGRKTTHEDAARQANIDVLLQRLYRAVYVDGPFVTVLVRDGLFVTQWGGTGAPIIEKEVGPNTRFEEVLVRGAVGLWITGAEHVVVRGPKRRAAASVLIWEQNGITYRIEGARSKDEALQLAADLRRP